MTLYQAMRNVVTRTFDFRGRASRMEFWSQILVFIGYWFVLYTIMQLIFMVINEGQRDEVIRVCGMIFAIALLITHVSVAIRRLHDRGHGIGQFIFGIFFGFGLQNLFHYLAPGDDGENEYGPDPLAPEPPRPTRLVS